MLSKFTWGDYIITTIIILVIYYLVVIFLYYRKDARAIINRQVGSKKPELKKVTESPHSSEDFEGLEAVVADLKKYVLIPAGREPNKTELLMKIRFRVAEYPGMKIRAYRVAINHFIIQQAEELCGIALSEKELEAEWEKLSR